MTQNWPRAICWLLLASPISLGGCEDASPVIQARYYWGAEVNVICPCVGEVCYWVDGSAEVIKPVQHFLQKKIKRPYQPVYLVFRGQLLDEAPVGFGANYDGLIQIDQVVLASRFECAGGPGQSSQTIRRWRFRAEIQSVRLGGAARCVASRRRIGHGDGRRRRPFGS